MEDFTRSNSLGKNSYQGLDEASYSQMSSLDFGAQSNPLLQDSYAPSMLNQITTTQFTGQQYDQQVLNNYLDEKAERKRQSDREYRERCKKRKMEVKENLEALGGENENLKEENESLKEENASMNQTLESQAEKIRQLRSDLNHVKSEYKKAKILEGILCSRLANADDLHLENQKLKDENVRLIRESVEMNDYSSAQLMKENSILRHENRVLKVQNDALCGKIANDNR